MRVRLSAYHRIINSLKMRLLLLIILVFCYCRFCDSTTVVINDDYCDNGDDEPNTAACSGLLRNSLVPTFKCLDQEYYVEMIYSSRVNDGDYNNYSLLSSFILFINRNM